MPARAGVSRNGGIRPPKTGDDGGAVRRPWRASGSGEGLGKYPPWKEEDEP